jgi:DNA-directed RNA polymerase specialized sigma24 family protein
MRQENLQAVIAQAIGQEAAQAAVEAVMDAFGGELHQMPRRRKSLDELRQHVRQLRYHHGLSVAEIAERLGRSESSVRRDLSQ